MSKYYNGGCFMLGADFSHHNWNANKSKIFNPAHLDFVIIKATEGKSYVDPAMNKWLELIAETRGESGAPFIIFYHYARPEKNIAYDEAKHFLNTIKPHIGNCGIALDWEGQALKVSNGEEWALDWLRTVESATDNLTTPLFYTSGANTRKYSRIAKTGFPLWVAHYDTDSPRVDCWQKPTIWQFTSTPFDLNIFFGTPADMVTLIHK